MPRSHRRAPRRIVRPLARVVALALGSVVTLGAQDAAPPHAGHATAPPRLQDDLGSHHRDIGTRVALAQRWFDRGLRLYYAFDHAEAIRAFEEAARLDPRCAVCHWGASLSYGPDINLAMDSTSGVAAWAALERARALAHHARPVDRALIDALGARYAPVPPADRARLDSAFVRAMAAVVRRFPADPDARTILAEARMDLRPWAYWRRDGSPQPGTRALVADLERVLREAPTHPGANHFYIHAIEAAAAALDSVRAGARDPALARERLEFNSAGDVLALAAAVLAGHLAAARHDTVAAIAGLREAIAREDALDYGEPPEWTIPVRQEAGQLLLDLGRAREAARAFREDLARFPDNHWSLTGLARALRAQGRTAEAAAVERRIARVQAGEARP